MSKIIENLNKIEQELKDRDIGMSCYDDRVKVCLGCMLNNISNEIQKIEKQLQEATGCLALYLEAEDMVAKKSCDKGTVKFLNSLED